MIPQSKTSRPAGPLTCQTCGDEFTRLDHLSRHTRSHNAERPFVCPTCGKGFTRGYVTTITRRFTYHTRRLSQANTGRRDSLSRHCRGHEASARAGLRNHRSIFNRIPRACTTCSKSKLRCHGGQPCGRCEEKGIQCTYTVRQRRIIQPANSDGNSVTTPSPQEDEASNTYTASFQHELSTTPQSTSTATLGQQPLDTYALDTLSRAAFMDAKQVLTPDDSQYPPLEPSVYALQPNSNWPYPSRNAPYSPQI